jgi:hypothetical protein
MSKIIDFKTIAENWGNVNISGDNVPVKNETQCDMKDCVYCQKNLCICGPELKIIVSDKIEPMVNTKEGKIKPLLVCVAYISRR